MNTSMWESDSFLGWMTSLSPLIFLLLGITFLSSSIPWAPKHRKVITFLSQPEDSANQTRHIYIYT
ncbi:putative pentatricopeptide repeat-containing protein [Iris pallida]|uniref:Pentatricopeptide repeat-containing protein n=1 Tax=Iris pallida TaxID=29817 RepID=A0AAX6F6X4_IRIPA|nr:putative pentatricopeptide repeat-containing protein [Iris pallida]